VRITSKREDESEDCAGARWWGEAPKVCPETLTGVHYSKREEKIVLVHAGGVWRQRFVPRPSPACITSKREDEEDCAGARWWGEGQRFVLETPPVCITSKREDE
jgi:hypothetical protein